MQIHRDPVTKSDGTPIIGRSPNREVYGSDGTHMLVPYSVACRQDGQPGVHVVPLGALQGAMIRDTAGGQLGPIVRCDWPPQNLGAIDPIVRVDVGGAPPASWQVNPTPNAVPVGTRLRLEVIDPLTGQPAPVNMFQLEVADGVGPRPYPTPNHRVNAYLVQTLPGTVAPGDQLEGARVVRVDNGDLVGMLLDGGASMFVFPG